MNCGNCDVTHKGSHPISVAQNLLCRFVIMQDSKINTAIDNRRVYHLVAYFFFLNVRFFGACLYFSYDFPRMCLWDLDHSF